MTMKNTFSLSVLRDLSIRGKMLFLAVVAASGFAIVLVISVILGQRSSRLGRAAQARWASPATQCKHRQ